MKKTIIALVGLAFLLLVIMPLALALPSSTTQVSGNDCRMFHNVQYSYNFNYNKNMTIGQEYDLDISFSIVRSTVTQLPFTVNVQIVPSGFTLSEKSFFLQSTTKTVKIIPTSNNPSLNIKTTLNLDGNTNPHRGYSASYSDNFQLSEFSINNKNVQSSITNQKTDIKEINKTVLVGSNKVDTRIDVTNLEPSKIPWYIVRATGIIAYILLALSVMLGLLRKVKPSFARSFCKHHCDISYLALILSVFHMVNNLIDNYRWSLKIKDLIWFNFSSRIHILLSLGVIAFYLMIIVVFTSVSPKIIAKIKYKKWYWIHISSYLLYVFVIIHSLLLGTDLVYGNPINFLSVISRIIFFSFIAVNTVLLTIFLYKRFFNKEIEKEAVKC